MEVRQFAERVLYGDTLEQKLQTVGALTDRSPGAGLRGLCLPGRPAGLGFSNTQSGRSEFPNPSQFEDDQQRGFALHFFANHELVALELMALMLLRFPEAPKAFRRRMVATMRDEQRHLGLYVDRMRELNVDFGSRSLSPFFWDLLAGVHKPEQFSAGMSLTLEQANLDFCVFYEAAFKKVGDTKTAALLQTVLQDEIAHVRHGVHHLTGATTANNGALWAKYTENLVYPLTPARGKGPVFSRGHRKLAGLDDDFIDRMAVYNQSRGRSPMVFAFDCNFEEGLRTASKRNLKGPLRQLQSDLETLPLFIAKRDDVVLVQEEPSPRHLAALQELGVGLPELLYYPDGLSEKQDPLANRRIDGFQPWGWSRSAAALLARYRGQTRTQTNGGEARHRAALEVAAKDWVSSRLEMCRSGLNPEEQGYLVESHLTTIQSSIEAVRAEIKRLTTLGFDRCVLKAPYSTAGRHARRTQGASVDHATQGWLERTLKIEGRVVVEPWFERLCDFSYLFDVSSGGMSKSIGFSRFLTDGNGRYRGAWLRDGVVPSEMRPVVGRWQQRGVKLEQMVSKLVERLTPELMNLGFDGLAGVDCMLVRTPSGEVKLRAPLEFNARPTMGHIAVQLSQRLDSRSRGFWFFFTRNDLESFALDSFESLQAHLRARYPQSLDEATGRLRRGIISTTPAQSAQRVWTCAVVDHGADAVRDTLTLFNRGGV
ncbi:MAG: DUF455 family protein [Bradymonadia bacterium]